MVDDIGLLPAGADETEAPYRLIDAAYKRRSLIVTSNLVRPASTPLLPPRAWPPAAVDRLLHPHVIVTEGQSHRLAEAIDGRGVQPQRVEL